MQPLGQSFLEKHARPTPYASGLRVKRIELVLRQRPIAQFELYRHIVKPAGCEAAIEMKQTGNDDPHDRDLDVRTRLIENEEIKSMAFYEIDTSHYLLALVEAAKVNVIVRPDRRVSVRRQIGMVAQIKRRRAVMVRRRGVACSHQSDGKKLVHLGQRSQQRNSRIEVRARAVFDKIMAILHGVRQRRKARNSEIAGDVEYPKPPSGIGKLSFEIADIGLVKPADVQFRPLQPVVPPDRIGIAFHQLQEALNDRFLDRVAGGAAVGIGVYVSCGRSVRIKKVQQAGGQVFETLVAQRPNRRPFDLGRWIEGRRGWRYVMTHDRGEATTLLRIAK